MNFDVEFDSGAFYPAVGAVELAQMAEDRGFGAVWKGESNSTDPLVLLSAMAAKTRSIKLGTAIYHIFGRSPVTLGIQAATLNDLSDGRLLLGLGVANQPIASWHSGTFDKPIRRIREYADIVRQVATGERVEYAGEIYRASSFKLSWRPSHPKVPILFAGLGEQMTRLAGRHADGVVVNMANPPMIREIVKRVSQGARDANRDPEQLEYVIKVRVCMNPDRDKAKAKLKQVLTFYMLAGAEGEGYNALFASMGFGAEARAVREAYERGGFRAGQAAIPDAMLDGDATRPPVPMVAATTIEEVRDRLQPYLEAGATRLVIPYVPTTEDAVGESRRFLESWR
ncbi:MAG TPA: LLM class flavin-dependent oxidoreductase [Chloroflexota bacterium]|nr:LLM class flavin-dependent oxidoreductase [Chloroflexota bacterium]